MKFSDWLSVATTITLCACLVLHTLTLRMHEQRMNALSCRIDLVNARIDLLNDVQIERPPCLDTLTLSQSKPAD